MTASQVEAAQAAQDILDTSVNTLNTAMTVNGFNFGSIYQTKAISTSIDSDSLVVLWTPLVVPGNYLLMYNLIVESDNTDDTIQSVLIEIAQNTATIPFETNFWRYVPNAADPKAKTLVTSINGSIPFYCTVGGTINLRINVVTRSQKSTTVYVSTLTSGQSSKFYGTKFLSFMTMPIQLIWLGNNASYSE